MFSDSDAKQVEATKETLRIIRDKKVIDWTEKQDVQKEMRRDIKKYLRSKGCPVEKVETLSREIVSLGRIQLKDV